MIVKKTDPRSWGGQQVPRPICKKCGCGLLYESEVEANLKGKGIESSPYLGVFFPHEGIVFCNCPGEYDSKMEDEK